MKTILAKVLLVALLSVTISMETSAESNSSHAYVPPSGFAPTQEVATTIAEAVLFNIYGRAQIEAQRPYKVNLTDGNWVIEGTASPRNLGGTFAIKISKVDGRILLVTHSR